MTTTKTQPNPAPSPDAQPVTAANGDGGEMTITGIVVHHDQAKQCPLRDIAEPVEFTVTARLRVTISRFKDVPPVTPERLAEIVVRALADDRITLAK